MATAAPSRVRSAAQSFTVSVTFAISLSMPGTMRLWSAKNARAAATRSSEQPEAIRGMKARNIGGSFFWMASKFSVKKR